MLDFPIHCRHIHSQHHSPHFHNALVVVEVLRQQIHHCLLFVVSDDDAHPQANIVVVVVAVLHVAHPNRRSQRSHFLVEQNLFGWMDEYGEAVVG